jgi:DNA-directed RNA polymerase specialized sigma24 family protein
VREFIHERRSGWARRVSLSGQLPDRPAVAGDHDAVLDLRAAVAALPPRQRAALVLRFYHLRLLGTNSANWTTQPIQH